MVRAIVADVGGITVDARTADKFLNDGTRGGDGMSGTIGVATFEMIGMMEDNVTVGDATMDGDVTMGCDCYILFCLFQLCYMLCSIIMFLFLRLFWQRLHHHCLMIPYDAILLIAPYGFILTLLLYNIALSLVTYKRAYVVDN